MAFPKQKWAVATLAAVVLLTLTYVVMNPKSNYKFTQLPKANIRIVDPVVDIEYQEMGTPKIDYAKTDRTTKKNLSSIGQLKSIVSRRNKTEGNMAAHDLANQKLL